MSSAICAWQSSATVSDLWSAAVCDLAALGFERSLASRVHNQVWLVKAAYADSDDALAEQMVEIGLSHPKRIGPALLEAEVVRRRQALLVRNPLHSRHVFSELVGLTKTPAYVAAPIVAFDEVIGFLHADYGLQRAPVDESARNLLMAYASALALAFERLSYKSQLDRLRAQVSALSGDVAELFLGEEEEHPGGGKPMRAMVGFDRTAKERVPGAGRLTARESEVLSRMAEGATNQQIASALVVTEATVKVHVKHVLRKLGASNRTEAVARYLANR